MVTDAREPKRQYPVPAAGNTIAEDFARLALALTAIGIDVAGLLQAVAAKALAIHQHQLADIVGLVAALANKAGVDHTHDLGGLSDVETAGAAVYQVLAKAADGQWRPWTIDLANVIGAAAYAKLDGSTFTTAPKVPTTATTADSNNAANVTMLRAAIATLKDQLVNGAGSALDTLYELAAALGNDANFAATMTAALAAKAAKTTKIKAGAGLSLDGVAGSTATPAEADLSADRLIRLVLASTAETVAGTDETLPAHSAGVHAAIAEALGKLTFPAGLKGSRVITASGTYIPSAGVTAALVFVVGGGGGGGGTNGSYQGRAGGMALGYVAVSGPMACVVGAGGGSNAAGGSSSLGGVSASGGAAGRTDNTGAHGVGTAGDLLFSGASRVDLTLFAGTNWGRNGNAGPTAGVQGVVVVWEF